VVAPPSCQRPQTWVRASKRIDGSLSPRPAVDRVAQNRGVRCREVQFLGGPLIGFKLLTVDRRQDWLLFALSSHGS